MRFYLLCPIFVTVNNKQPFQRKINKETIEAFSSCLTPYQLINL